MSWKWTWIAALLLAGAPGSGALAAPGEDVADWALPDAEVAILFRRANALADIVDAVEKRFGGVGPVDRAVAAWRAWEIGGVRPVARQWGPGLALGRGVAVYGHTDKRVRLVLGADDEALAKSTLAALFAPLGEKVIATPEGLTLGEESLKCGLRGGFLVCDPQEAPPASAPGRPAWLKDAPVNADGDLVMHARGGVLEAMSKGEDIATAAWLSIGLVEDRVELTADVTLAPAVMQPAAMLVADGGEATALSQVSAETPFLLKLSFDGPRLMDGAAQVLPPMPPPVKPLWAATRAAWSGDVTLSFDASPMHPVLVFGLQDGADGAGWVETLLSTLQQMGAPLRAEASPTHPSLRCVAVTPPDADGTLRIHYTTLKDAVVFALVPADLERRAAGKLRPLVLPEAFAARGAHGLMLWDAPILLDMPFFGEIWEGGAETGWLDDVQIGAALARALLGEMGLQVQARADGVRARMWWGVL